MTGMKRPLVAALGALVALGGLAATATSANAAVVCNRYNECWHVHGDRLNYPADVGISFYDDTWAFPDTTYHWVKDRDDRGYWLHGRWHRF